MGRMLEELAPEFGLHVGLRLDENNNVDGAGITAENFDGIGVAIDFSIPGAVVPTVEKLAPLGVHLAIGTTGWLGDIARVRAAVDEHGIGLVHGANFSIGVQAFYQIVGRAAKLLAEEEDYDAWLYEAHHKHKLDAPSGTALRLLEHMSQQGYGRPIDVATNRVGAVPGWHEVGFDSEADTIRVRHEARSRVGFARGALRAARWILERKGMYEFSSVWEQMR